MKLTNRETADICRSLGMLLHVGIRMADSACLLSAEHTGSLGELLKQMGEQMDLGAGLWEVMEKSGAFSTDVCAMVRLGEETGTLEDALTALADYYDQRHRTYHQIRNALVYPSLILLLMLGVIGILLVKVLPVFDSVYASLGAGMTGISAELLHLGGVLQAGMPVLFGMLALAAVVVLVLSRCETLSERVRICILSRFGDRGTLRSFQNARFARALAMGMATGLPMEEALTLAGNLLRDVPGAAGRCDSCGQALAKGEELSRALAQSGFLPPTYSRMLSVGIRSGDPDRVMKDIADRMMEDAEEKLAVTISRIEPAMVLLASVLVGVILLCVMVPLLDVLAVIG